jgi:hypothetical protein
MNFRIAISAALGFFVALCNPANARPGLVSRTYQVADLVVPASGGKATIQDWLLRSLTRDVAPKTWEDAGGCGTAQYFPLGLCLVVHQTEEVHAQVASFLRILRLLRMATVLGPARKQSPSNRLDSSAVRGPQAATR